MGSENSIGYLEGEAIIAVIRDEDERDKERPLLRRFTRRNHGAEQITVRRRFRRPGQVRHTSLGGQSTPIRRGEWTEDHYEPSYLKMHADLTTADVALFVDADKAEVGSQVTQDANERIRELGTDIREDNAEERHRMCLGAMRDALDYIPMGHASPISVDYQLNQIATPSTIWTNSAATIPEDMGTFQKAYRDANNRAKKFNTIIYNPDIWQSCFIGNTQWNAYRQASPRLAEGFLGIGSGQMSGDKLGLIDPLWGYRWLAIEGKYVDYQGNVVDRWPVNTLGLCRMDDGDDLYEWGMLTDPWQNPTADYNVELLTPTHGQAVKVARATLFDNGLPVLKDPSLVQYVEVF